MTRILLRDRLTHLIQSGIKQHCAQLYRDKIL